MSDILMVNPLFVPYWGGTEKVIYEVGRRLASGFDITVLTARIPGTKKEEEIEGMKVLRARAFVVNKLPHPLPPPYPVAPSKLKHLIRETRKHDIVHFHNRFYYTPVDFMVAKKAKRKLALTIHNSRPKGIDPVTDFWGTTYDDIIGRQMMDMCDGLTAVSRDALTETIPEEAWERSFVVYNGVDENRFNPRIEGDGLRENLGIHDDEVMVLSVARLVEQKGIKYLIDSIERIKNLPVKLVILGRGPKEDALRKRTRSLGIDDKVLMITEKIPEEMLPRLYAASDIFALPSLYEPFGIVAVEAMACGKPVVASRVGGLKEIVTPEVGFLAEPRNPDDMASKIAILAGDENLRRKMGKKARERVEEKFTWDHSAQGYARFYEWLLGR